MALPKVSNDMLNAFEKSVKSLRQDDNIKKHLDRIKLENPVVYTILIGFAKEVADSCNDRAGCAAIMSGLGS